jgi:hypothetical protein
MYNEDLVQQILDGELGDYALMRTLNDFRLLLCSWVYDLNFPATRKAVLERGYLDELLSGLPDTTPDPAGSGHGFLHTCAKMSGHS